jgi:hypothetical protein
MKIQSLLTDQLTQVDVDRSPKAIPTRKSLRLHALDVGERVADVLKIEFHPTLFQASSLTPPFSEEMAVGTLTRFVAIRAGNRLLLRRLRMG